MEREVAVSLSFDESSKVLLITFSGEVTDEVFLGQYAEAKQWISTHGHVSQLADFRDITAFRVTPSAIREQANREPLAPDQYLRVVIAPQKQIYGMFRMLEILGSGTRDRFYLVPTLEEAYETLGITSAHFKPVLPFENRMCG